MLLFIVWYVSSRSYALVVPSVSFHGTQWNSVAYINDRLAQLCHAWVVASRTWLRTTCTSETEMFSELNRMVVPYCMRFCVSYHLSWEMMALGMCLLFLVRSLVWSRSIVSWRFACCQPCTSFSRFPHHCGNIGIVICTCIWLLVLWRPLHCTCSTLLYWNTTLKVEYSSRMFRWKKKFIFRSFIPPTSVPIIVLLLGSIS